MPKLTKGQILDSHWGYDQTNVDFYEVQNDAAVGQFVKLRKLKNRSLGEDSFMSGKTEPVLGEYANDEVLRRKVKTGWQGDPWVNIKSYAGASLWDGTPQRESWYA